jgi:NhaA family Na+:H+ antiporter
VHRDHDPDPSDPYDIASPPEVWDAAKRAAVRLVSPIQRILAIEAASGLVLVAATAIALVWANSPWREHYQGIWEATIGFEIAGWSFARPLHFWVNDGLMTIFFFVVGLEIRRELYEGELAEPRRAALPVAAAIGGMLVPAAIYALLNAGRAGSAGWGIPMATDIAFAVGVLTLLGNRVDPTLRILLLALAVIDDIGAIVVIAVFYNHGIALEGLALIAGGGVAVLVLRMVGVRAPAVYLVPGVAVWAGFYWLGVHPTIAGVLLGMAAPVRPWFGPAGFARATLEHLHEIRDGSDRAGLNERLQKIERARREALSPADRLQHLLHPWVAFVIMPVFALANAGVVLGGAEWSGDAAYVFLGIILGLAIGKPLGIVAASSIAVRARIAQRGANVTTRGVTLVGLVGGIGFTMSLFIAQLAFPPGPLLDTAKLAILVGSAIGAIAGALFGLLASRRADG